MVMTILEARVDPSQWAVLEAAYRAGAQQRDAGLVQSFLAHDVRDSAVWRILTVWSSRAALEQMRSSGETPRGVLMFRSAQAEPTLSILEIREQITA